MSKMSTALDVTSYNEALKVFCKEEKVKYVDTNASYGRFIMERTEVT